MGFRIGDTNFAGKPIVLAPMEGVTDQQFRLMCRDYGADLVFTEFVSADALIRKVNRTIRKINIDPIERPVAIQIYGKDAHIMANAAKVVEESQPEIIDINFGCPVRKIASKGAGAGLLRDIPLMVKIAEEVVKAVNVPVTAKTRLGWDSRDMPIKEIALRLQDVGIQALSIHGRTRKQMYTGKSDWSLMKEIKEMNNIHIPIIGNGDISNAEEAMHAFNSFGVDGIMIGRASIGAPWIFKEVSHYLKTGEKLQNFSSADKLDILKLLLKKNCDICGETRGILHTRRHLAMSSLFFGLENFRELRVKMLRADSLLGIEEILEYIRETYFC